VGRGLGGGLFTYAGVIECLDYLSLSLHNSTSDVSILIECSLTVHFACRIVHLCRRLSDRKLVIIKQIPMEQMTADERQAALNEVMVLAMLDHPNIIRYYENFLEDTALMIVMEYAEGKCCYMLTPAVCHNLHNIMTVFTTY